MFARELEALITTTGRLQEKKMLEIDRKVTDVLPSAIDLCLQLFCDDLDSWPISPTQLMFAHDLEKIATLTETSTAAIKEIDQKKGTERFIQCSPCNRSAN